MFKLLVENYKMSFYASKFNTISTVVLSLLTPFLPYMELIFITFIINNFQEGSDMSFIGILIIAVLFYFLKGIIESWDLYVLNSRFKINKYFREILWENAYKMDFGNFVDSKKQTKYTKAQDAINKGFLGPAGTIYQIKIIAEQLVLIIALIIFSAFIDIKISFIITINIFISYMIIKKINQHEFNKQSKLTEERIKVKQFENYIADIEYGKEIRIFNFGEIFLNKINNYYEKLFNINNEYTNKSAKYYIIIEILNIVVLLFNLLIIIQMLIINKISIGTVILFIGFNFSLLNIFVSIIENFKKIKSLLYFSENYYHYLSSIASEREINRNQQTESINSFERLEFQNVSYKYSDSIDEYALKNISFIINKGDNICLVGINGSGKSTIIRLIQGLIKPTSGTIFINDIPIDKINQESLVKMISTIFQENVLYALSLLKNIDPESLYSKAHITRELENNNLIHENEDISKLQITQYFSDKGKVFSGGEVQKLKYVQTMFAQSEILLLDEPTSAMDLKSENEFFKKIFGEFGKRTIILITHKVEVAKYFNRVIIIKEGLLVGDDNYTNLISMNKHFKNLINEDYK